MSGVGITYLWTSKEFPPFVRLEGRRGEYEVYTPERACNLVRCEDCIEYEPYHTYAGMKLDCGMCMEHGHETNDYRFCAWGTKAVSE